MLPAGVEVEVRVGILRDHLVLVSYLASESTDIDRLLVGPQSHDISLRRHDLFALLIFKKSCGSGGTLES